MIKKITQIYKNKTEDKHLKELLTGSSSAFTLKIIGMIFSYIFTLLITRNLGADAMGVYALSLTVLNVFSILGRLGLDTALLRFVAEFSAQGRKDLVKEIYNRSLKMIIPFSLLLALILFSVAPYIAKYVFHKEYLSLYFRVISLAILPVVLTLINSSLLRAIKKIIAFAFFQHISNFLFASLTMILLLLFSNNKLLPVVSLIVSLFISAVLSQFLWLKNSQLHSVQESNQTTFKSILDVSMPMLFASSISFVLHWIDTLMLGIFRTDGEVGIYNITVKVAMFASITLFTINSITAPKCAEFYGKKDIDGLRKITMHSTKLIFWTSFPLIIVIFLFPSFILGIFGKEFKTGSYALMFLASGQFISAISGSVAIILNMTGNQKVFQNIILLVTILNVIMNLLLIPVYGINGAAFANMISIILNNLLCVFYIHRIFGIFTIYLPFLKRT
jgi:O-antigen/teichoic acid export membrane protein